MKAALAASQRRLHFLSGTQEEDRSNGQVGNQQDSLRRSPRRREVQRPVLNLALYDVYPTKSVQRLAEPAEINHVRLSPGAKAFTLILNANGLASFPDYAIEVYRSNGTNIWRSGGLKRDNYGNFTIMLERSFLPRGIYVWRLYGGAGESRTTLAEYLIGIE